MPLKIFQKTPVSSAADQDSVVQIAQSVTSRFMTARMETEPFPYLFVEKVFPEEFYSRLELALQEARPLFKEQVNHGHHSTYSDRSEFKVLRQDGKANPEIPNVWYNLLDVLSSPQFLAAAKARFEPAFREKLGRFSDDRRLHQFLDPALMVTKHRANYYLGPHTDRREKILTCVFNFPTRSDVEDIGTALYVPKQEGFTSDGATHFDPKAFNYLKTTPFRRNSALIFGRLDNSFHGVERLSDEQLKGDERFNVQFNIWDWGRRPKFLGIW